MDNYADYICRQLTLSDVETLYDVINLSIPFL